jgi:hypothetical protein
VVLVVLVVLLAEGGIGWGVQKHEIKFKKIHLGSSQKNVAFFSSFVFLSPSVVCFDLFYRVFGRLVTNARSKKKRD